MVELDKRERHDLLALRVQRQRHLQVRRAPVQGLAWGIAPKPKQRRPIQPSTKRPSILF